MDVSYCWTTPGIFVPVFGDRYHSPDSLDLESVEFCWCAVAFGIYSWNRGIEIHSASLSPSNVAFSFFLSFFFLKTTLGSDLHTYTQTEEKSDRLKDPWGAKAELLLSLVGSVFFFLKHYSLSLSPRLSPLLSLSLFQVVNAFTLLTVVSNQLVWVWVCVWVCECVSLISSGGGDPSRLCSDMSDHRSSSLLSLVESLDVGSSYSFDHFTGILAPLQ